MANWKPIFSQGKNANPRRCFDEEGNEIYIIIYQRKGDDPELMDTRRVVGTGADRASAWDSLRRAISRYDSTASFPLVS